MAVELVIPRSFDPAQAAHWFGPWKSSEEEPELRLRLPKGAFLQPTGVALLAAGIARRQQRGWKTTLVHDAGAEDTYRHLQRIDFFEELGVTPPKDFQRHEPAGGFVPLKRIVSLKVARELADRSIECLEHQLKDVAVSPLRMARFIFEELGANVVQHSGAAETGFGIVQAFPERKRLELAFADAGVGFRRSLERNPELEGRIADDGEALQLALSKGLTGGIPLKQNVGMGLGLLQDFADRVGGDLWIASGDALLRRRTAVGNVRTNTLSSTAGWQGSWLCLDAPMA